jgi:FkbM family methyltransferase
MTLHEFFFSWYCSIGDALNKFLGLFDLKLIRRSRASIDFGSALKRISTRDIEINTIIDIGASDGRWSKEAMQYFPNASYFLIEANPLHEENLKRFKTNHKNVDYIVAAAGNIEGKAYFLCEDLFGGLASHESSTNGKCIESLMTTVDAQVKKNNLKPPFLIKMDTHGFEVPIIEGAKKSLDTTNYLILETYNFRVAPNSLLFYEMCDYLEKMGFRPIDLYEPFFRPKDNFWWQIDLIFARSDIKELSDNTFK